MVDEIVSGNLGRRYAHALGYFSHTHKGAVNGGVGMCSWINNGVHLGTSYSWGVPMGLFC